MRTPFAFWPTAALATALIASAASVHAATPAPKTEAQTRYPIVLVHGLLGFDDILGLDYFYQVPADLRKNGATVLVAKVSAVNDNDVRGEQLLKQLREWQAAKGYAKFNLIGHSQGGPTARYAAGIAPQLVASVTTVGSPHTIPTGGRQDVIGNLLNNYVGVVSFIGNFVDWASGHKDLPEDEAALKAWSENTAAFNARFPAGMPATPCASGPEWASNGVAYYSVTGNKPKTNVFDPADLLMKASEIPSDGLVGVCSAAWGKVLRNDYPWNHFDEVNQVLGLMGTGAPDPVAFYRQQAARLKLQGL
ncbi:MAG: triacylglycerol lipase [Rubrivivax sp.]|nr:MAG: triacylglycerol lipase [Rubrivivax sp.]